MDAAPAAALPSRMKPNNDEKSVLTLCLSHSGMNDVNFRNMAPCASKTSTLPHGKSTLQKRRRLLDLTMRFSPKLY